MCSHPLPRTQRKWNYFCSKIRHAAKLGPAELRRKSFREFVVAASILDLAAAAGRTQSALENVLRETAAPAERAGLLASLLEPFAPTGLSACFLTGDGTSSVAWQASSPLPLFLDGKEGRKLPADLAERLTEEFAGIDPLGDGVQHLPELERHLSLHSQAAAVAHGGRAWGFLLVAQAEELPADWVAVTEALLLGMARTLALQLQLEDEIRQRREAQERLAENAELALLGESAAGLAHELNNCLNSILLQTSIVQMRASHELRKELEVIRQHGRQAAALLRPLHQIRQERRRRFVPVDLNQCVREVVAAERDGSRLFRLDLAPQLRPLQATRDGLSKVVRWLLHTALLRQPSASGFVSVQTSGEGTRVLLTVEDAGPAVAEPVLEHLFEMEEGLFVPANVLESLAGHSLLRQFGGELQAWARPEGGVILAVEWN
jgi:two-component system NtrC family sensor kinase